MENVHGGGGGGSAGAADCDTVNVSPATVSVPVRAEPVLASTLNLTMPLPDPVEAPTMVIHDAFDAAVHAQPAVVVTFVEPLPPVESTSWRVGEIAYVQGAGGGGAGAAACDTVNVCPPAVKVPIRAAPVFAATVNATVPLPVPDVPLVSVIHATFDAAVHGQPLEVLTFVEPLPPFAPMSALEGEIE